MARWPILRPTILACLISSMDTSTRWAGLAMVWVLDRWAMWLAAVCGCMVSRNVTISSMNAVCRASLALS